MEESGITYQMVLKGESLTPWEEWFRDVQIDLKDGNTQLTVSVADQTALLGLLRTIHSLHITLLSVKLLS